MSQSFKVEISVVQAGLVRIYNWEVVEIISCLIFGTQVPVELLWKQFVCGSEWAGFKRIWAQSCLFGFIQSICFANQLYFQFHSSLSVSDFASSICCLEYAFEYYLRSRIFFWVLEFMTFFFFLLTPLYVRSLIWVQVSWSQPLFLKTLYTLFHCLLTFDSIENTVRLVLFLFIFIYFLPE